MTVVLTTCETDIIWRSADPGDKAVSIPGSVPRNKGYDLDIVTTVADSSTYIVTPTSGTINGQPSFSFTEPLNEHCTLSLRSDADNADWIVRCLCCTLSQVVVVVCPIGANIPGDTVHFLSFNGPNPNWPINSNLFTMSTWLRVDALPPNINGWVITGFGGGIVSILLEEDGSIKFQLTNGVTGLVAQTTDNFITPGTTYFNILFSYNSTTGVIQCYINDNLVTLNVTLNATPFTITFGGPSSTFPWVFYGEPVSRHFSGDVAEIWCAPGQYIDFSVVGNRRKFIDATGCFVYLGANGLIPTGVQPSFFFTGAGVPEVGEANFRDNAGSIGGSNAVPFSNPLIAPTCDTSFLCP